MGRYKSDIKWEIIPAMHVKMHLKKIFENFTYSKLKSKEKETKVMTYGMILTFYSIIIIL